MRALTGCLAVFAVLGVTTSAEAATCDDAEAAWLACEDFEGADAGWTTWFDASPFLECNGCPDGVNDPARILLTDAEANDGSWSLHMPAEASANYQGASLAYRSCASEPQSGCSLQGHDQLYFRTFVKLAADHQYVHHFLSIAGTRPDAYWESDGNAGCRPNGYRSAGTTLDFNENHELFFYTYFPEMNCDSGGYCSGTYAEDICNGCAQKDMPCENALECCWGNHFAPDAPVILERDEWVCLELMMELNTPGQADGRMAFWVNDELGHEQTGMHWRDVPELQLNKTWLQHYVANGDADQPNRIWFDDVVVSTERIGCLSSIPPGGTDSGGTDSGGADTSDDGATASGGSADSATDAGGTDGVTSSAGTSGSGGSSGGADEDESSGCGCTNAPSTFGMWLLGLLVAIRRRG